MRFLVDETCDFSVVRAPRAEGHDVTAIAEGSPGIEDPGVIDLALREERILVTEDKDFGRLLHASGRPGPGVLFLRSPGGSRATLAKMVVELVRRRGTDLPRRFVVLRPGKVRIGRRSEP